MSNLSHNSHPFENSIFIEQLKAGLAESILKMIGLPTQFNNDPLEHGWISTVDISVLLELNVDQYNGLIIYHYNKKLIELISEKFIEKNFNKSEKDLLDAAGEFSNFFYGATKTKLNKIDFQLPLSLPKPLLTQNLNHSKNSIKQIVLPYEVSHNLGFIELQILT